MWTGRTCSGLSTSNRAVHPHPAYPIGKLFSQWLQWVLLPKMRFILDQEAPLPPASSIHILAQEALKDMDQDMSRLIAAIRRFDRLLSGDDA